MKQRLLTLGVLTVLLLFAALIPIASVPASADDSNFDSIVTTGDVTVGDDLTVGDAATFAAGVTSADLTATDDVVVGDDLTIAGDLIMTPPVRWSLSATQTLTPVTANVPISSSAAAGFLPVCAAGKIFHFHNVGSQNIIITDSTTSKIASTFTMGNSDSITLLGVGSNCVELARANN